MMKLDDSKAGYLTLKDDFFQDFAGQVFNLDRHIRFVGMASQESQEGKLLGYK
jgi:hypothetical protein